MQDVRSLIHQAHTENWEELDLSGMNLTELPPEIACLTELRSLILGKEEVGEWKDGEYVPITIANQLTTLPEELGGLVNLREIDLSGNPIAHFPHYSPHPSDFSVPLRSVHYSAVATGSGDIFLVCVIRGKIEWCRWR